MVKTTLDAVAFAEYLKRGNIGKMVLKVLVPVLSGMGIGKTVSNPLSARDYTTILVSPHSFADGSILRGCL